MDAMVIRLASVLCCVLTSEENRRTRERAVWLSPICKLSRLGMQLLSCSHKKGLGVTKIASYDTTASQLPSAAGFRAQLDLRPCKRLHALGTSCRAVHRDACKRLV